MSLKKKKRMFYSCFTKSGHCIEQKMFQFFSKMFALFFFLNKNRKIALIIILKHHLYALVLIVIKLFCTSNSKIQIYLQKK